MVYFQVIQKLFQIPYLLQDIESMGKMEMMMSMFLEGFFFFFSLHFYRINVFNFNKTNIEMVAYFIFFPYFRHPLTNEDFRKMLMTPKPSSSSYSETVRHARKE